MTDAPNNDLPATAFTITAPGIERAHAALRSLVTEATGVLVSDSMSIELQHGGKAIAHIQITDETVWREFANDMGFRA